MAAEIAKICLNYVIWKYSVTDLYWLQIKEEKGWYNTEDFKQEM